MIVSRVKTQILFGVFVVGLTAVMVYVQMKNLSQEAEAAPEPEPILVLPEPVVAPEPEPEPEPEPVAVVVEPEPEPAPEPEPFVMKTVGGADQIDGEYIVSFFDGDDRAKFIKLVTRDGGEVLSLTDYGNAVKVRLKNDQQFEKLLTEGPLPVDYSANYEVYYPERPAEEELKPDRLYGVFGKNSLLWLGLKKDHMDWGRGVKVAVLDNGVQEHGVFKKNRISHIDIAPPDNGVGGAGGHGTAVASLIAGWHPEVVGVAPDAEILSVRVAGSDGRGDVFDAAQGIMKALEADADVISISLGTYGDSFALRNAIAEAVKRGVVVVASVGNDGKEQVAYPAAYEGVVGVSAVDALGQKLYFGNTGEGVDICAPGFGVQAAWTKGQFIDDFTGTSASVPYVSGMIAALLGRELDAETATARVLDLADDSGEPGRDDEFGNGILDIRRIEEHGTEGIRDAALSCLRFDDGKVTIGFQNRGTQILEGARITVKYGKKITNFNIGSTKPGETIARHFSVTEHDYDDKGILAIFAEILPTGLRDQYPGNNARRAVLVAP